ncbi:hypothetical protein FNYG_15727 [Fusarium nygamai]|uniref:Uncharacterized protein n=1 Tax=Gibberella nygamai TaxID=42673 RepID=A0A2K0U724_GIBNY|nr:hypothetical protein FNYG_15727 [Fusarium nygamai]
MPAFVGAQLGRRKCEASFADSAKNNENTSESWAPRRTDNDTWVHNQNRT